MRDASQKILARRSRHEFFGRDAELASIERFAAGAPGCLRVAHGPGFGATELLKQAFDSMFRSGGPLIPVYFSVRRSDRTAARCARRFLYQFLVQAAAFRLREPKLMAYSPTLEEIVETSPASDQHWMSRLALFLRAAEIPGSDERFVGSSFGAALRAADAAPALFFIDNINAVSQLAEGEAMVAAFDDAASALQNHFIFAELRRSHLGITSTGDLSLREMPHSDVGRMIETTARDLRVDATEPARDLLAAQIGGRPAFVSAMLRSASAKNAVLATFRHVQSVYADEVIGGRIARRFSRVIDLVADTTASRKRVIGSLHDIYDSDGEGIATEIWERRSGLGDGALTALEALDRNEFVTISGGRIFEPQADQFLIDYVGVRFRLEAGGGNRALVVGDTLSSALKRAPQIVSALYRGRSATGLREMLAAFDGRDVPLSFFDRADFHIEYGGMSDDEALHAISSESERLKLPQIVQSLDGEALYKPISQFTDRRRCAVGRGFTSKTYAADAEEAWIAAEIDSKLAASRDLAEFWCDRLEMIALVCGFERYRIWLVAPEGFDEDAAEALRARGAFGSSKRQAKLLQRQLQIATAERTGEAVEEYEIVVPMGEDAEMIAAHAVEEIAKRHDLDPRSINQIKTALVEACINAAEHGHSPDRKIYQRFVFEKDKITIVISNRGLRLTDRRPSESRESEGRRGWGLSLMRRLMDEVSIEDVEDGTSISMTKYLARSA